MFLLFPIFVFVLLPHHFVTLSPAVSPTETTALSINDQPMKEILDSLEQKCMGHDESEMCVFFGNYNNPDDSKFICSKKAITDEDLEESMKMVSEMSVSSSCEPATVNTDFWLPVGVSVLNIAIAYATVGVEKPIRAALWAALGDFVPEAFSKGVNAWECEDNQLVLQE